MPNDIESLRAEVELLRAQLVDALAANEKAKVSEFRRGRLNMRGEVAKYCASSLRYMTTFDGTEASCEIVRAMARGLSEYLNA